MIITVPKSKMLLFKRRIVGCRLKTRVQPAANCQKCKQLNTLAYCSHACTHSVETPKSGAREHLEFLQRTAPTSQVAGARVSSVSGRWALRRANSRFALFICYCKSRSSRCICEQNATQLLDHIFKIFHQKIKPDKKQLIFLEPQRKNKIMSGS